MSTSNTPGLVQRLRLRLLLSGWAPRVLVPHLHAAVLADDVARAAYDAARAADRRATRATAIAPAQVDLVEDLLFAQLPAEASSSSSASSSASSWRWALPALAATAGVLVVVGLRPGDDGWTTRGADVDVVRVGLHVRCLDDKGAVVVDDAEVSPQLAEATLRCPRGSLVSWSVTNLEAAPQYLWVVGVDADDDLRFFAPFTEATTSQAIAAGTVDSPLPVVADTGAFDVDDRVTLLALFSAQPLDGVDVARTLRGLVGRGVRPAVVERLPLTAHVARIELQP